MCITPNEKRESNVGFTSRAHPARRRRVPNSEIRLRECRTIDVYTDGSKSADKTSAAYCLYKDDQWYDKSFGLARDCTVFQAEALAIREGLREVTRHTCDVVNIFTDSLSVLNAINSFAPMSPLILSIQELIRELEGRRVRVTIVKVKAHNNNVGNERADRVAKSHPCGEITYNEIPLEHYYRRVQEQVVHEWREQWERQQTVRRRKTYEFMKEPRTRLGMRYFVPSFHLTQYLTGHGNFRSYLHRIGVLQTDRCEYCPDEEDTPVHRITSCVRYTEAREEASRELGFVVDERTDLSALVSSAENFHVFKQLVLNIVFYQ